MTTRRLEEKFMGWDIFKVSHPKGLIHTEYFAEKGVWYEVSLSLILLKNKIRDKEATKRMR